MNKHRFVWHDLNTKDLDGAKRFYGEVWPPYVAVANTDSLCELASRLGATVMVPPTDIPDVGRFACWSDPQQASIAVLQPAR